MFMKTLGENWPTFFTLRKWITDFKRGKVSDQVQVICYLSKHVGKSSVAIVNTDTRSNSGLQRY